MTEKKDTKSPTEILSEMTANERRELYMNRKKSGNEMQGIKLFRDKLDPNFHYRWARSDNGGVEDCLNKGYDYVTSKDGSGSRVSERGGTDRYGKEYRMLLMRLPMEWRLEDLRAKQQQANAEMNTIKNGVELDKHANVSAEVSLEK